MITFERKKIKNKWYFYLTEQIRAENKYKKIQVFVGKNIPSDTRVFYAALALKERAIFPKKNLYTSSSLLPIHYRAVELARIDWKYFTAQMSPTKYQKLLDEFAISFIYESNAIEGSRLSRAEVAAIVQKKYIKKSLPRHEIQEAQNAVAAFSIIQSPNFSLSQKNLKALHTLVVRDLNIPLGFKKESIVVNNKATTVPKEVRLELKKLFTWYKDSRHDLPPFERALIFHNRFELIHPFTDGNGRVGRLLLNWMLLISKYGVILFRHKNRIAYFSALNKGDEGRYRNLLTLASKTHTMTITSITGRES